MSTAAASPRHDTVVLVGAGWVVEVVVHRLLADIGTGVLR